MLPGGNQGKLLLLRRQESLDLRQPGASSGRNVEIILSKGANAGQRAGANSGVVLWIGLDFCR